MLQIIASMWLTVHKDTVPEAALGSSAICSVCGLSAVHSDSSASWNLCHLKCILNST